MGAPTSMSRTGTLLSGARLTCAALVLLLQGACTPPAPEATTTAPAIDPDIPQWDLDWAEGIVFYQVFVRSFADSDGDGIGDFNGLIAKLDYLNDGDPETDADLGVEGLYLMPIFEAASSHGNDTIDYEAIDPDYGTMEDFQHFLDAAHERGIKVVLDFSINHTSRRHPWFVDSASGAEAEHRDWYVWRDDDPGWKQPWGAQNGSTWHAANGAYYYGLFGAGMPDLNFDSSGARAEVKRLARTWLDRGVDGLRLAATRHIHASGPAALQNDRPQTYAFWRDFSTEIRSYHPDALLLGETPASTPVIATYYGDTSGVTRGYALPMHLDFPLADAVGSSVWQGDPRPIAQTLHEIRTYYPAGVLSGTFLSHHDRARLARRLGDDTAKLQVAAAILLTLPGTPFLYYGQELGMHDGVTGEGDPDTRTPMAWDGNRGGGFTTGRPWHAFAPGRAEANVAAQTDDLGSLLGYHRRLIHLRHSWPALQQGELQLLTDPGRASEALIFLRTHGDQRLLVAHNLSAVKAHEGPLDLGASALNLVFHTYDYLPEAGHPDGGVSATGQSGAWMVHLPAGASAVWQLR